MWAAKATTCAATTAAISPRHWPLQRGGIPAQAHVRLGTRRQATTPPVSVLCLRATTTAVVSTIPAATPTSGVLRSTVVHTRTTAASTTITPTWAAATTARAAAIPSAASAIKTIKNAEFRMRAWLWGRVLFRANHLA